MIIEMFLNPIFFLINSLIGIIPVFSLPSQITGSLQSFITLVSGLSYFVPLGDFLFCAGLIIAFKLFGLGLYVMNWIIRKIPTVS